MSQYTFGLELEFANINTKIPLPEGCGWSKKEYDLVNSNGIANDPSRKYYKYGGEINTPYTYDIDGQIKISEQIIDIFQPYITITYRCYLHGHIAWPGITKNVEDMKEMITYLREYETDILSHIWPYEEEQLKLMDRRMRRFFLYDRKSMPDRVYDLCMKATTPEEFKLAHATTSNGKINWALVKRYMVNMYSIFMHGTLEFRHFYGTLNLNEIKSVLEYSQAFVENILGPRLSFQKFISLPEHSHWVFPKQTGFDPKLEETFQQTSFHFNTREVAIANIKRILSR